ncbi:MAG: Rho termination factor N-terminal domain-containing protein, partial [Prochlorococcus sp.]
MTQALTSLARLTIRQLRQMASDLGVTLYSRKSKKDLLNAIAVRQEKRESDQLAADPSQTEGNSPLKDAAEADITSATTGLKDNSTTRVVFLPRDPQWAYVFWEISE